MDGVVHHPAQHPFVDNLWPARRCAPVSVWDVPALRAAGTRLVHLHFGFEGRDADDVASWAGALRRSGIALVHTAHDLDNPHLRTQEPFHRTVDVLARAADAVTTLTPTAADVLRRRSGVDATVIAHPHVVPFADMERHRRPGADRSGIYVHAATCRPNLDIDAIARLVARPSARRALVHVRSTAPPAALAQLRRVAATGRVQLDVRPRLDDAELWARIATSELVVLPYRWGTHSGLLEAAHDLGTPVLAPAFGGYADQGAHTYDGDPADAVDAAIGEAPALTVADRRRQRQRLRRRFAEVHQHAVAAVA